MSEPFSNNVAGRVLSAPAGSDFFAEDEETHECPRCHGTGGDPMDDYCTPCDHCGGEGYEWWK